MTIDEILNDVMQTPNNTNRAVLKDMLEQLENGGNSMEIIPIILTGIFPISTITAADALQGLNEGKIYAIYYQLQDDSYRYYVGNLTHIIHNNKVTAGVVWIRDYYSGSSPEEQIPIDFFYIDISDTEPQWKLQTHSKITVTL